MENDIQQQTGVEKAKQKLQEVAETKDGRSDPRAAAETSLTRIKTATDARVPDENRVIKAGTKKPNKPKFGRRLKEAFFNENIGNGSITDHIFFDYIVPSCKKMLYEGLNTALCSVLNLDPRTNRIVPSANNVHTANASQYARQYNGSANRYSAKSPIADCRWDEATAKDYFNEMIEVVEKYGDLSVSNVCAICCVEKRIQTTDKNWGWTRAMMSRADVYAVDSSKEEWIIDLPDPRPLGGY